MKELVHYIIAPIHYTWTDISITSQANSQLSRVQPLINFVSHVYVFVVVDLPTHGREGGRESEKEGGVEGRGRKKRGRSRQRKLQQQSKQGSH